MKKRLDSDRQGYTPKDSYEHKKQHSPDPPYDYDAPSHPKDYYPSHDGYYKHKGEDMNENLSTAILLLQILISRLGQDQA